MTNAWFHAFTTSRMSEQLLSVPEVIGKWMIAASGLMQFGGEG
jgi:hypothetical protein